MVEACLMVLASRSRPARRTARPVAAGRVTRLRAVPPASGRPAEGGAGRAHLTGRVAATSRMPAMCAAPLGAFLGGWLATTYDVRTPLYAATRKARRPPPGGLRRSSRVLRAQRGCVSSTSRDSGVPATTSSGVATGA
ncbi:hypothetical protein CF166_21195 [Amycolatopsis sp. KNN50.9b]|nr:hypothetical protein CF166_21195 [Amycolatopsis sp. KNN50.9b]